MTSIFLKNMPRLYLQLFVCISFLTLPILVACDNSANTAEKASEHRSELLLSQHENEEKHEKTQINVKNHGNIDISAENSMADSESAAQSTHSSAIETENGATPEKGGHIVMGSIGEPSTLIPFLATDSASHEIASMLFVAPLRYDKNLKIEPWAAESYEVLNDGRLLRFVLRKGIMWEDGVELTADDVEFTYNIIINPTTPTAYAEDFLAVTRFTKTGRYSFEVEYDKPFARALVSWMQAIMPRHILEGVEGQALATHPFARKPVAVGPYSLDTWQVGSHIILKAVENYFEGEALLSDVIYRIIPDNATMFLELKAGKLDMMGLSPQQYLRQTNTQKWQEEWNKYKYLSFGYTFLGYNLRHPFFTDAKVRRALTHAIDREGIVKGVLLGMGEPVIGPYKPKTWVYNTEITPYEYSPDMARALMAEAGWRDTDGDGLLDKDGVPFAFTILTNQGNDQRIKAATIIQSQLKQIGIKVQIRTVEWAAFIKEFVNKGRFDAVLLAWSIGQDPDSFEVWHSSKAFEGGLNFIGYSNSEVDEVLEKGRRALSLEERKKLYDRFQVLLHEDQPYCFLYAPYALPIVQARFRGIEPAPAGITYNFIDWWVSRRDQNPTLQR
ncbi:MAG: ABC transporter substrate-binding protein [Pseudomonadota bacterium]